MSFRDNRFIDWRGNHHLCGDVNFDGFVNWEDYEMARKQLYRSIADPFGTKEGEYNPNADQDRDGFITPDDLALIESQFGKVSPYYCWHPNPSMINNGQGWTINTSDIAGETFVVGVPELEKEIDVSFNQNYKRGFKIRIFFCGAGGGWAEVDFTPNAHYSFNPDWRNIQPTDFPLEQLENHEFIIELELNEWSTTTEAGEWYWYLGTYFGGWVILKKPYEIWFGGDGTIPASKIGESNILEVMISPKQSDSHVAFSPGGDSWHRIFIRPAEHTWNDYAHGWFILHYILDDPRLGTVVERVDGKKILSLLRTIEGTDVVLSLNPPTAVKLGLQGYWIRGPISLEGAYFRPVYVSLEGYVEFASVSATVSVHGMYHYIRRKGHLWAPKVSKLVSVNIQG